MLFKGYFRAKVLMVEKYTAPDEVRKAENFHNAMLVLPLTYSVMDKIMLFVFKQELIVQRSL